jgi:hypothetical protein
MDLYGSGYRAVVGSFEHSNEPSDFVIDGDFID